MIEMTVWLVILVMLILIEIATLNLTTIWFACGALVASFAAVAEVPFIVQLIIFVVVSLVVMFLLRPSALRYFNQKRVKTNYESIIGLNAKVIETVDNNAMKGKAMVNGQEWTARAVSNDMIIEAGSKAKVVKISGVKLILTVENNDKK